MAFHMRARTHARSRSTPRASLSSSSSSSSIYEDCTQQVPSAAPVPHRVRVAVVGTGREALALSPLSAEQFRHNLNMSVCSSPELNVQFKMHQPTPRPNPNPGPVLRRIASEYGPSSSFSTPGASTSQSLGRSALPPVTRTRGLPPPPRVNTPRRRPPPVFVSTLGAPLAVAEQAASPFTSPNGRARSTPPSASSWASSSSSDDDLELDVEGLEASYDEYDFSAVGHGEDDRESAEEGVKSPLGGAYFPPCDDTYSPLSSPRHIRQLRAGSPLGVRRPLRVQVSVERVAFRDNSPLHLQQPHPLRYDGDADLEDGIKTRRVESGVAVHAMGGQRATRVSLGKALGRWLKKHA
ncbi:hypothetical protein BDV93DRAFT_519414 [Ceratobasidium sp. AG-I]|nr:hypothetical protein BDV93DRAFT_519414 [Ceratobasidium sp. AG-I]